MMTKTNIVSTVGGQKIPPVDHYIAGFQAGAKAANPKVKTLNDYSNTFTDTGEVQAAGAEPDRRRARTSSSRLPATAAWARSAPPRRRASGASASTPTRPTWARTS